MDEMLSADTDIHPRNDTLSSKLRATGPGYWAWVQYLRCASVHNVNCLTFKPHLGQDFSRTHQNPDPTRLND